MDRSTQLLNLESTADTSQDRPIGVWIFSVFYGLTALFAIAGWLVVLSDTIPLEGPEKEYYQNLTALDYLVTFVLAGLTLTAGLTLFLLRRVAAWLFTLTLILGLPHTVWHLSSKGLASTLNASSLAGLFLQWGLLAWACLYSWGLARKGRLN